MADLNKKSGSKTAQKSRTKGRDLEYWKKRLVRRTFKYNSETRLAKDWSVRIQHAGRRQFFNLETPNRDAAASKAKKISEFVRAHGWKAAEAEFKHAEEKTRVKTEEQSITVGAYLNAVTELATDHRPRTLAVYASSLRRLVGQIIAPNGKRPSRDRIDRTPLAVITEDKIEKWKVTRLRDCDGNPVAEDKAKITANSILRNCRAAFGRKLLTAGRREALRKAGLFLPEPLPLSHCGLFEEDTSGKFSHVIPVEKLLKAVSAELAPPRKEDESEAEFEVRQQQFLAFLLVFAGGLRKGEADTLEWSAVDLEAGTITIQTTRYFRPKTKASQRPVRLDPETVEIFKRMRTQFPENEFILRSTTKPRPGNKHAHYRCETTWQGLAAWLAKKGVQDQKPIHYLRKASSAFVARKFGIFAAQRHARHTTPAITQRYYSDSEETVAPGFGKLMGTEKNAPVDKTNGEPSNRK